MDLDDEELKATRMMNGADRKGRINKMEQDINKNIRILEESIIQEKYHLYKNDLKKCVSNVIKAYKQLVDISIETAFDDTNKDTELLCRVLLNQKQITIENGMYHRENFDWEKHLKILGLENVREKNFFVQDSQIDEYTKQLEYKIEELEKELNSVKEIYYTQKEIEENYIPVSLVEEKIEEVNKEDENLMYKNNIIKILQELLEKRK